MTQEGKGGGYNAGRSAGAANSALAMVPPRWAGARRGSVGRQEEHWEMCAVFHRNPTMRRRDPAPVVWRAEPAPRPAGVSTHWHRNSGGLRGARQFQPAYSPTGSRDSIMVSMQGRPPWEAACPLSGDQSDGATEVP